MRAFFIITLLKVLSLFPLSILHKLGVILGRLLYLTPNQAKKIAVANIQHCFPDKTPQEQDRLVRNTLIETAKAFTESSAIWFWPKKKLQKLLHPAPSTKAFEEACQQKKSVIAIAPHLGAWEMSGFFAAETHITTAMYRPPRLARLDAIIRKGRENLGMKLAPTTPQGIRLLSRALKNQECIGILPDQDPGKNGGIFAPFFKQPANTMTLVSRLAKKSKAPAFIIYAERLPKGKGFLIHSKPCPETINTGTLEESVQCLNNTIEQCILQFPEQYQWNYKRFKNQPKGYPNIYRFK